MTLFGLGACGHPQTASGGGAYPPSGIPSRACLGNAPVDDAISGIPNVRASWFNPSATERLYVLEAGPVNPRRPTLVLIHGVGAIGTKDFYPVLEALSHHRHVLAVDLPGFGRSNPDDDDFGPDRLVRAVDSVVRACGTKRIDVLGHSSGGSLALLFSAHRADAVRRLVVVDAAGILLPEVLLRGQLHEALTGAREERPVGAKIAEKLGQALIETLYTVGPSATAMGKSGLLGNSPPTLAATRLIDYNFGQAIVGVHAETLVVWGKNDHVVPPRIAHLLDERIANSELTFIEDAGHLPMRDQPELFAALVSGYLDGGLSSIRAQRGEPLVKPPNTSTRSGHCQDQENVVFEGDFEDIDVLRCKLVWFHDMRARHVSIRDSEGRLDGAEVSAGLEVRDSELSMTGGQFRGDVALSIRNSKLDVAGANIVGDDLALDMQSDSEIVFSVTQLASPKTARLMHQELSPKTELQM